jgi:hypothetical protein
VDVEHRVVWVHTTSKGNEVKNALQRILIFFSAIIVRVIPAYIFYGSIDVSAFIGIHAHTLNHTLELYPAAIWCSFPVIPFYLWLCGLISILTCLPLAFCFKMVPIFFDALLAVLLFDLVRHVRPRHALRVGMLYALSPIALIITCIHGQWEALPIFFFVLALYVRTCFQDSYKKHFTYGALFAFSFLLKPLPMVFGLFFFTPWPLLRQHLGRLYSIMCVLCSVAIALIGIVFFACKINRSLSLSLCMQRVVVSPYLLGSVGVLVLLVVVLVISVKPRLSWPPDFKKYLAYQLSGIVGALVMIGICFIALTAYGFNVLCMIDKVLRYFNQGIQTCGLPFGYPFNQGLLALVLKNRVWLMVVLACFAVLYYRGKFDIFHAVLASLMLIFGASGISPQYLLWVPPFLLITGFYRTAAFFTFVCTTFFFVYYMHPMTNPVVPYQSMLSFAALKYFSWLMPPSFFMQEWSLTLVRVLGNYIVPLVCLGTVAVVLWYVRSGTLRLNFSSQQPLCIIKNGYLIASFCLTVGIALLMTVVTQTGHAEIFRRRYAQSLDSYNVAYVGSYVTGNYGSTKIYNIIFLLIILTFVWSVGVWHMREKK